METVTHRGACHCGRVRFEVDASPRLKVTRCNCSVCAMSGHLGVIVPAERFRVLSGEEALVTYTFNTGRAQHTFCGTCGIKPFYRPRSHPEGVSVHLGCLDPATVASTSITEVDGQNWEALFSDGHNAPFDN
jgi:hypothetical protein